MNKIAGISYVKTASGKRSSKVTIDLKKHPEFEDVILDIEATRILEQGNFLPLDDLIKKLDKKHGIKRK